MEERRLCRLDDWMGVWGKQSFLQWSKEEEALLAALQGRDKRTDDDAAITDHSLLWAAFESRQETKWVEEEALRAASFRRRGRRTDDECPRGT